MSTMFPRSKSPRVLALVAANDALQMAVIRRESDEELNRLDAIRSNCIAKLNARDRKHWSVQNIIR
jgi:hypothetical protein